LHSALRSFVYGLFRADGRLINSTVDEVKLVEEMQKEIAKQKRQLPTKWPMHDPRVV
jgi:hypothetical protein